MLSSSPFFFSFSEEALEEELALVPGYESFFSFSRTKAGYSGTVDCFFSLLRPKLRLAVIKTLSFWSLSSGVATYCRQSTGVPVKAEEGVTGWRGSEKPEESVAFLAAVDDCDGTTSVDLESLDAEGRCVLTQHRLAVSKQAAAHACTLLDMNEMKLCVPSGGPTSGVKAIFNLSLLE